MSALLSIQDNHDLDGLSYLSWILINDGVLTPKIAHQAEDTAAHSGLDVAHVLISTCAISPLSIAKAFANLHQTFLVNLDEIPPDRKLLLEFGPARAISSGILPWRKQGGSTFFVTDNPENFAHCADEMARKFGTIKVAISTRDDINQSVTSLCGAQLAERAETRVAADQSCRTWDSRKAMIALFGFVIGFGFLAIWSPDTTIAIVFFLATSVLLINTALKCAAAIASRDVQNTHEAPPDASLALPRISLLVPLFKETEIAGHLLKRLGEINYPRELLDVCLITESDDLLTQSTLQRVSMPPWIRQIIVPQGTLRTKPRALNYALDFAHGSIIGIYDAEDAPAPNQLRIVAAHFAHCASDVACVQGILDYYNDTRNWLTRCFTIEYATWFRIVLPGLERLGLVVPLGGTTLFFRRDLLENLGGWDAHNVTEDAELGVRLARAGYRTELINTVTREEANGRFWPWVKQRSRWLKGYAITYAVHMRSPRKLWQDLGPKRFFGVQLLFAGTLSQFVLAPALWSFWLIPFGYDHPFLEIMSVEQFWTLAGIFFASEVVNLIIAATALRKAQKTWLIKWLITLQFYFPLAAIAAYKGLIELAWKPFYWEKTAHGVLPPNEPTPPLQPPLRRASDA